MRIENPLEIHAEVELLSGADVFGKSQSSGELSELQKAYRDFFTAKLKEYEVDSPAELSPTDMSKFFNEISSGWEKRKAQLEA